MTQICCRLPYSSFALHQWRIWSGPLRMQSMCLRWCTVSLHHPSGVPSTTHKEPYAPLALCSYCSSRRYNENFQSLNLRKADKFREILILKSAKIQKNIQKFFRDFTRQFSIYPFFFSCCNWNWFLLQIRCAFTEIYLYGLLHKVSGYNTGSEINLPVMWMSIP